MIFKWSLTTIHETLEIIERFVVYRIVKMRYTVWDWIRKQITKPLLNILFQSNAAIFKHFDTLNEECRGLSIPRLGKKS